MDLCLRHRRPFQAEPAHDLAPPEGAPRGAASDPEPDRSLVLLCAGSRRGFAPGWPRIPAQIIVEPEIAIVEGTPEPGRRQFRKKSREETAAPAARRRQSLEGRRGGGG